MLLSFRWRWMEKEPFVLSLSETFTGSGQLPQHALGSGVQLKNQLCMVGSRQAGLPQGSGEEKPLCPHFILRMYRGIITPKKCNLSSGSPGMAHLPTIPQQGCIPKGERCAALCCHTSSLMPPLLLQKLLT